jgi:hypothetical protein
MMMYTMMKALQTMVQNEAALCCRVVVEAL